MARPNCPKCGKPAILTDERFGGKYECRDCNMWSWGGKPLKTAQENKEARQSFKARQERAQAALDGLGDHDPMWQPSGTWATATRPAWAVSLGLDYPATLAQVNEAYRRLVKTHHPDAGGSLSAMQRLNEARDAAHKALKG